MTTKKELRDALQRLADAAENTQCGCADSECRELRDAKNGARALLARPARVVGYRVRHASGAVPCTHRASVLQTLARARELCVAHQEKFGGKLYRLAVR